MSQLDAAGQRADYINFQMAESLLMKAISLDDTHNLNGTGEKLVARIRYAMQRTANGAAPL